MPSKTRSQKQHENDVEKLESVEESSREKVFQILKGPFSLLPGQIYEVGLETGPRGTGILGDRGE